MRFSLVVVLCLHLCGASWLAGQAPIEIHHLDVGQGHATLIVGPTGRTCLVDCGDFSAGGGAVLPALQGLGLGRLDVTVLTHYHTDHWGGFPTVLPALLGPTEAFDRGSQRVTSNVTSYWNAVGAARRTISPGTVIDLGGGATLTAVVVNGVTRGGSSLPLSGTTQEENARSVALHLRYGGYDELITGDLTGGGNGTPDVEALVGPEVGDIDVLVVGHHGSSTSTSAGFLSALTPEAAVIPVGVQSPYGHPHQDTLTRLLAQPSLSDIWRLQPGSSVSGGATVFGSLRIVTDGRTWTASGPGIAQRTRPVDEVVPGLFTPVAGEVVISEWMADPQAVSDAVGEWFELENRTAVALDLSGYVVADEGVDQFTIQGLLLPPRGRVVLGREGATAVNGGVPVDWVWPAGAMALANTADEILLFDPQGRALDRVAWDGSTPYPQRGRSVERRDRTALSETTNFTDATQSYGAGDLGTPGLRNSADQSPPVVSLVATGTGAPGSTLSLTVGAGIALANRPYQLGIALGADVGLLLPSSRRVVPLNLDPLLLLSVQGGLPGAMGWSGQTNFLGLALGRLPVPPDPALSGLELHFGGVLLDAGAPDGVAAIMDRVPFRIR